MGQVWQSAIVNAAKRPDWRSWVAAARHPAPTDGVIAVALLVLPWVIVLALKLLHHLNDTAVTILASASIGLPTVWLAWVPIRNANRSSAARSASSADAEGLAQDAEATRPTGAVQVSEADPRRLGVHAAISVPGVPDEVPPEYVPRDADTAEFGVQAKVVAAARRGGFMLLVGGSSVGKTRSAVEAVKALLPDWWLVHPAGSAEVAALAQAPKPRTVVWLDELQRYLDAEHGLTGGVIRALLNAPHPAVIIATLWPDLYVTYTTVPQPGAADPYAREREVLGLANVVRIDPEFSEVEQDRARAAAARDPRLQVALEATGYGLTQTLAAAPQLVARWEDAQTASPYGSAVLTAALDVARLDAGAPLSADFLRAAAPGYLTSQQQAEAPDDWFEQALAYATAKLHGTAAALSPTGADMGQVAGYTAADYLSQHASRERRYARVPASTWDAILNHVRDPADAARLAVILLREALRTGDQAALDAAIDLLRLAVAASPADDPDRAAMLSNLGIALQERFERTRGTGPTWTRRSTCSGRRWRPARPATPTAVACFPTSAAPCRPGSSGPGTWPTWTPRSTRGRQAVAASPADDPGRAGYLSNLGAALLGRFVRTGDLADLDAAIDALRRAVAASPADHPGRTAMLSNLGGRPAGAVRAGRGPGRPGRGGRPAQAGGGGHPGRRPRPRYDAVQPRYRPADPV